MADQRFRGCGLNRSRSCIFKSLVFAARPARAFTHTQYGRGVQARRNHVGKRIALGRADPSPTMSAKTVRLARSLGNPLPSGVCRPREDRDATGIGTGSRGKHSLSEHDPEPCGKLFLILNSP